MAEAKSQERVYILSEDYWGFDAASKNDTLNFYDNVWILKKNQYDGLPDEVRNQLYRCALFYHTSRVDNHGYTPLAIRDEGAIVKVRGPNRQGLPEVITYDKGSQSPPYVVTDGTDTITMRAADPSATDMAQLEAVGATTTPGTFLINDFIYKEKDILDTINKLESEIGDVINAKSAEFVAPTDAPPAGYEMDGSRPLAENPQTEGFSADHTQGYDDRDDESVAERHRGSHSQDLKSRRDESKGMTDALDPHHPYSDVSTMSADGESAPETAPAAAAIQVSDPPAINPPAEEYSTANVQYDPTGIEGGYTPQNTFDVAAEHGETGFEPTDREGPKSATLQHRLSAKARSKARKAARAAKALDYPHKFGAEVNPVVMSDNVEETHVPGVPVVPNERGEDSSIAGYGVPQWYGSAEEAVPLTEEVPMGEEMRQVMTTQAFGQAGGNYDHMIHYSSETEGGIEQPGSDDNFVMMPDAGIDILAPANAYGTNSAIVSGQGVPQWYGSAEHSQGYDSRDDESVAERHRGSHTQDLKDRRDESKAMTDHWDPHHPYADVSTMSAESRFDKLAHKISMQYQDKGWSKSEADEMGRKTAAVIGRRKYGPKKFAQMGRAGRRAAKHAEEVNPMHFSSNVDVDHIQGVPVINNSWGGDSSDGMGRGAPQWYGSAEYHNEEVNPMYFEQVDGHDALGVGLPVIANDFGQDSAGGIGRGVPQFYGAESPASVAVDESNPESYHPYEFVDEMSPDGEYMTGDDFMSLLAETIDGMGARYQKPSMFGSPVVMAAGGALMAWLGMNLYNRQ